MRVCNINLWFRIHILLVNTLSTGFSYERRLQSHSLTIYSHLFAWKHCTLPLRCCLLPVALYSLYVACMYSARNQARVWTTSVQPHMRSGAWARISHRSVLVTSLIHIGCSAFAFYRCNCVTWFAGNPAACILVYRNERHLRLLNFRE